MGTCLLYVLRVSRVGCKGKHKMRIGILLALMVMMTTLGGTDGVTTTFVHNEVWGGSDCSSPLGPTQVVLFPQACQANDPTSSAAAPCTSGTTSSSKVFCTSVTIDVEGDGLAGYAGSMEFSADGCGPGNLTRVLLFPNPNACMPTIFWENEGCGGTKTPGTTYVTDQCFSSGDPANPFSRKSFCNTGGNTSSSPANRPANSSNLAVACLLLCSFLFLISLLF